ncbi:Uroporphyrinogen III decarboxylase [Vulgatibacter incomptus]|uniref:Uroporphyrinogen decarboxylase n=2 Tax=Vulgatibacter incomptus TaxID=1391653 RepID=A0A0K1P9S4_9BACT|nr:Uroporphyrinogen III decarboxylase [Vulgatibacter incomptus]
MRQAGRYLPQYREVRGKTTFLGLCKTPELAAEVTVQPVDLIGVDAAILFSDILIPVEAMGMRVEFHENEGPVLPEPIRNQADIERLAIFDPSERTPFTLEAIRQTVRALDRRVPLIGFAGAPFTLAAYMLEGRGSKSWLGVKRLMATEPRLAHELFGKIASAIGQYLVAQIEAGCDAVQIFDSWGGELGPADFERWTLPYVQRIVADVKAKAPHVPVIFFGTGMSTLLPKLKDTGADVLGLDWRIELKDARKILGDDVAVQGNLDPTALFLPKEEITRRVEEIISQNAGRPGHIFNLGHGITPPTDPDHARHLVNEVHRLGARKA